MGYECEHSWLLRARLNYMCGCRVRFSDGYDFRRGGKLMGLCSGECKTGCMASADQMSTRIMWGPYVFPALCAIFFRRAVFFACFRIYSTASQLVPTCVTRRAPLLSRRQQLILNMIRTCASQGFCSVLCCKTILSYML